MKRKCSELNSNKKETYVQQVGHMFLLVSVNRK